MTTIIILIAYYFDFKSNKNTFSKDLINGILVCIGLFLSAMGFVKLLGLTYIHGILYIGVELIVLFTLKAFIENHNSK